MKRISLAHQTIFAELLQQCLDAAFDEQFPENGSFVTKTQKNRKYWYYEGYGTTSGGATKARKYSKYVGPHDDPETAKRVKNFQRLKTGYRERRSLVVSLRDIGLPTPSTIVGDVVEALWKAGIFRLRGVLVGTLAYQTYAGLLGVRLPSAPIMTGDIDFAQFHAVSMLVHDSMPPMLETLRSVDPTFRAKPHLRGRSATAFSNKTGFDVEFLTPNRAGDDNAGKPAKMPALGGASAQPLRYLDFLIRSPVQSVLLHKAGIAVTVPAPERYAVHKLIVSMLRRKDAIGVAKSRKDIAQAGLLVEALDLNSRQIDLGFAWMEAWDRGPHWRQHLTAGKKRLEPLQVSLLQAAVREACDRDEKSIADYGSAEAPVDRRQ